MTPLAARVAALGTLIADRWPNGKEARLVADLARTLPRSVAYMASVTADGFPSSTAGNPDRVGSRSSSGDGIVSTVARRDKPTAAYEALSGHLTAAALGVAQNDRHAICDALRAAQGVVDVWQPPVVVQASATRCAAKADEALEPWVRPECPENSVKDGLCMACYQRRWRWRKGAA